MPRPSTEAIFRRNGLAASHGRACRRQRAIALRACIAINQIRSCEFFAGVHSGRSGVQLIQAPYPARKNMGLPRREPLYSNGARLQDAPVREPVVADSGICGSWRKVRRAGKFDANGQKKTRARSLHARVY
jgi:hypothetical protein